MKAVLKNIVSRILIWEAKHVLEKYKPKIIAVTGSVGKTSTKDAIYTILSHTEHTRKSEKSFNSEIGVPLTVLGLPNAWSSPLGWIENIFAGLLLLIKKNKYPEWLVLEVGVDRPGDIQRLSWIRSNIVIFTYFPDVPVHVEYFETPEQVIEEKRQLKHTLQADGTLVCNADDPKMENEEVGEGQHKLTYGFAESAIVRGFNYVVTYADNRPTGISFSVQFQEKVIHYQYQGVLGLHHVYPLLAALTVVVSEGKSFERSVEGLAEHEPAPGRMRLLRGREGSTIVDDTYNSSPVAAQAGLLALETVQLSGKKIVVLGDMLELGDFSVREHKNLGKMVADIADIFVVVGVRMNDAVEVARAENGRCKRIEVFQTKKDAISFLHEVIAYGDVVYVKGSQGMRMERIVEHILENPQEDAKYLARQDSHWRSIK